MRPKLLMVLAALTLLLPPPQAPLQSVASAKDDDLSRVLGKVDTITADDEGKFHFTVLSKDSASPPSLDIDVTSKSSERMIQLVLLAMEEEIQVEVFATKAGKVKIVRLRQTEIAP